jgi:hypothetical protein
MNQEIPLHPLLDNSSKRRSLNGNASRPWFRRVLLSGVGSAFCLIILTILLALPITVLIIGIYYHDRRYCPVEPRISLFLIVHGSVSLGWILLTFISIILIIMATRRRSVTATIPAIILYAILCLIMIFSFAWVIIGSIWTLSVHGRVIYEYDTNYYFYPFYYCNSSLYEFTFVYLFLSYVFIAIQCCYQCCTNPFVSEQPT